MLWVADVAGRSGSLDLTSRNAIASISKGICTIRRAGFAAANARSLKAWVPTYQL